MSISSLRRFAVLLAVALVSFLIFACQSMKTKSPDAKRQQSTRDILMRQDIFCEESNKSMSRPLICVDDREGRSVPGSIRIHDVEASPDGYPTKHPVTVHWFTRRSANLQLKYKSDGCRVLTQPECDGRGHCEATVNVRLEKDAKPQKCTYGISVDALKDPYGDIIIQPCCY